MLWIRLATAVIGSLLVVFYEWTGISCFLLSCVRSSALT